MSSLNSNQIKAVQVLASGGSIQEAAEKAGVTERTIYNWRQSDMAFRAKLTEQADIVFFEGVGHLSALIKNAATVLQSVMDDEKVSARDRVSAARAALAEARQFREQYNLQQRVEAIEAQLAAPEGDTTP